MAEAIKACRVLGIDYQSRDEKAPSKRHVAPYGLLTGLRRYPVARQQDDPTGSIRLYVVEKIKDAHVSNEPFDRDAAFNSVQSASTLTRRPPNCQPVFGLRRLCDNWVPETGSQRLGVWAPPYAQRL